MIYKLVALVALCLGCVLPQAGIAATGDCSLIEKPVDVGELRIGVSHATPFVIGDILSGIEREGPPEGLGVELWNEIADCLEIRAKLEFVPFKDLEELLTAVHAKDVDLALSAIPIDAATEAKVDLSVPIHQGALAVLVPDRPSSANFRLILSKLVESNILLIIVGLAGFLLLVSIWYWIVERSKGNRFFSEGPLWGLYRSFIFSALLIFRGRGDPFDMKSQSGQMLMVAVMLVGVTIISSLTALITSNLTLQGLEPQISTRADLKGRKIAVRRDSSRALEWAIAEDLNVRQVRTYSQVLLNMDEGRIEAFIDDEEKLMHLMKIQTLRGVRLSPLRIAPQDYAIAFPVDSDLRKPVNLAILNLRATKDWTGKFDKFLAGR